MTTHNMYLSRPYSIWRNMRSRCIYPDGIHYKNYGAKGISTTLKWNTFIGFWGDMKKGYKDDLTLDRVDNNKGYNKKNCRWVTRKDQARNREDNILYKGEFAIDASKRLGGAKTLVSKRIGRGWEVKKAFTQKSRIKTK